ncbi:M48 family metallopeptidase [Nocardioides sp. SYSU D00038]|uniref:M48 family metallopeptidase n=1 Tax=Nocardioides sp. SYSU D00038 TaxID=2812554 RepID=UPI001967D48C|nr:M48 family metallopeptidase [Nocardioides sp. SYSU D00038]
MSTTAPTEPDDAGASDARSPSGPSARRVALGVLVVGLATFVLLAWWLVPWDPVPGGPLRPAAPEDVFTAAEIARAEEFSRVSMLWRYSSLAVSLAVALVLGLGPWGARVVGRLRGPWWWRSVLAVAALDVLGRVVTLPFAVLLRRRVLEEGLSHQSWAGFAADLVRNEALDVVLTSVVVLMLVGCARRWARAWPAAAGGVLGVLVLVGSFAYPVLVEPLFNDFSSLPDGTLRSEILELADREGVRVDDVLVADASRRTTTLNAYVSGIGATRRVVVYDNLVDDLGRQETLSVVAHELAHARHDDVVTGTLLGVAGVLAGVGLLGLLWGGRRRSGPDARDGGDDSGLADPRTVPRLLALVAIGTLLASPVQNAVSRQIELRADVDALRATRDPAAFVDMQTELARRSLADPTPPALAQWWFGSHPRALLRIALARRVAGD